jgi:hypothetical protein
MYLTPRTGAALRFAYDLHHKCFDQSNIPYIFHPYRVAESVAQYTNFNLESLTVVALLHDVLEDRWMNIKDLITVAQSYDLIFTEEELRWLIALTRKEDETYAEYITRTLQEPETTFLKMEDVRDNLFRDFLGKEYPASLKQRYWGALHRLMDKAAEWEVDYDEDI